MPTPTYRTVHDRIQRSRGPATDYECCECGGPAHHWAYQYSAEVELRDDRGRVYSTDPADYFAMCRACHNRLDNPRRFALHHARMDFDPEYVSMFQTFGREGGRIGGATMSKRRRRCDTCGVVYSPAGMAHHMKASRHAGWTDLAA